MPRKTKSASKTKTKSTKSKIVVKHNVGAKSGNINININTKTTKRKKGESKTNPKLPQPQPSYAPMVQQVQPQQMGDSTALNTIMANLMQKDQEYKNRLDSTILIPDTTPQYKIKPQPIETAITNEIRRPKPTPIALNFDPPKEKPSLLKRIFGSRKSNKIPETPAITYKPPEITHKPPEISPYPDLNPTRPIFYYPKPEDIQVSDTTPPLTPKDKKKVIEYKPEITPSTPIETKKKSTIPNFLKATSSLVFGPPRQLSKELSPITISTKPSASAPQSISTQTNETQTKGITQDVFESSIQNDIKQLVDESTDQKLTYAKFKNKFSAILNKLGVPSGMRNVYYTTHWKLYNTEYDKPKIETAVPKKKKSTTIISGVPLDIGSISEITLDPQYDDGAGVGFKK